MKKSFEEGDKILAAAFADKSDKLAAETRDALETGKTVANLTARIDGLQELLDEETPNGRKAQLGPMLAELLRNRTELASGKMFTAKELDALSARIRNLEAQLLPSEKISSN